MTSCADIFDEDMETFGLYKPYANPPQSKKHSRSVYMFTRLAGKLAILGHIGGIGS